MAVGKEQVILALLSMPRLTVKAYIAALPAVIRQKAKDDAYRAYVTEALRLIGENTAKYAGGSYIKAHYTEIIEEKPKETRTSDEIVIQIKSKLKAVEMA